MNTLSARRRRWLLLLSVSCFVLALVTLTLVMYGPSVSSSRTGLVFAYLLLMGLLVVFLTVGRMDLVSHNPGSRWWLHPPSLITVWVLGFLGLPALYFLLRPDILVPLKLFTVDPAYTVAGTWLVVLGCLFLWIGYGVSLRFWKSPAFIQRLARQQPAKIVVLGAFGVVVMVQLLQIMVVGIAYGADASRLGAFVSLQQWLSYVQDAAYLLLTLTALKVFGREWSLWTLVPIVAVQLGFGLISGFMKPVLWVGLILFLAALVARVRLRRLAVPVVAFLLLGLLVVPVAEDLRSRENLGLLDTDDPGQVVGATADSVTEIWSSSASAVWQQALDRTMFRNAIVASTPGIIMQKTPSVIPYQGLEEFLAIPAYVIPRALWPDKPVLSRGNWFGIVYLNQPEFSTSSAAITVFGEGYMYAGWVGTLLACLILGALLAAVYRTTADVGLWAVYIALVPTFIDIEGQFTGIFVALIQQTLVFIAIYWLIMWLSSPRKIASRGERAGVRSAPRSLPRPDISSGTELS